jgi:hypothetical protein
MMSRLVAALPAGAVAEPMFRDHAAGTEAPPADRLECR